MTRYLIEQVTLKELGELSKLAIDAYASLDEADKDLYLDGLIQNQYGFGWYLQGNFVLAEKYWKNALDLHEKISPADHRAVAWRSYNMGLVSVAMENYDAALKWYLYAEERWAQSGDETPSCISFIRSERAQALTFLERFNEAKTCFDSAMSHLKESKEWGWLSMYAILPLLIRN
jgi:tetratricopeptide (TPR) repeat protein